MVELAYPGSYVKEITTQICFLLREHGHAFATNTVKNEIQDVHICGCLVAAMCTKFDEVVTRLVADITAKRPEALLFYQFTHEFKIDASDDEALLDLCKFARKCGSKMCNNLCIEGLSDIEGGNIKLNASLADLEEILLGLYHQYERQQFCDVTLKATEELETCGITTVEISAHKIVLAAASEYFRSKWANEYSDSALESQVVNTNVESLDALLKFIYTGYVILSSEEELLQLYLLADMWQVNSLFPLCTQYFENRLSPCKTVKIIGQASCPVHLKQAAMVRFQNIKEEAQGIPFTLDTCMEVFCHVGNAFAVPWDLLEHALKHAALNIRDISAHSKFDVITPDLLVQIVDLSQDESSVCDVLCHWGKMWHDRCGEDSGDCMGSNVNSLLPICDLWEAAPPARRTTLGAAIVAGLRSCSPREPVKIVNEADKKVHHSQIIVAATKIVQQWLADGFQDPEGVLRQACLDLTIVGMATALRSMPVTPPTQLCASWRRWRASYQPRIGNEQKSCPNAMLKKYRPLADVFSTPGMPYHVLQAISMFLQDELDGIGLDGVVDMLNQAADLRGLLYPQVVRQSMFVEVEGFNYEMGGEYCLVEGVHGNGRPVYVNKFDRLLWHDKGMWLITGTQDFLRQNRNEYLYVHSEDYTPDEALGRWKASDKKEASVYLPKKVHGMTVMRQLDRNKFIADGTQIRERTGYVVANLAYRKSKNDADKDGNSITWGSCVSGVDERDGWIKVDRKVKVTCCCIRIDSNSESDIVLCRAAAMVLRIMLSGNPFDSEYLATIWKLTPKAFAVLSMLLSECTTLKSCHPFYFGDHRQLELSAVTMPDVQLLQVAFNAASKADCEEAWTKAIITEGSSMSVRVAQCFSGLWDALFYTWATVPGAIQCSKQDAGLPVAFIRLSQLVVAIDSLNWLERLAIVDKLRDVICNTMTRCLEATEEGLSSCVRILDAASCEGASAAHCEALSRVALQVATKHVREHEEVIKEFSAPALSQILKCMKIADVINPAAFLQRWAQHQVSLHNENAGEETPFLGAEEPLAVLIVLLQRDEGNTWQAEAWKAAETEIEQHGTTSAHMWAHCLRLYRHSGCVDEAGILSELALSIMVKGFQSFAISDSFLDFRAEELLFVSKNLNLEAIDINGLVTRWVKHGCNSIRAKKTQDLVHALEQIEVDRRIMCPCLKVIAAAMTARLDEHQIAEKLDEHQQGVPKHANKKCPEVQAAMENEESKKEEERILRSKEKQAMQVLQEEHERAKLQVATLSKQLLENQEKMRALQAFFDHFSEAFGDASSWVNEVVNTPLPSSTS